MKKLAFIFNPKSGKGKIENHLVDIINVFSKADYEITVVPTKGKNYCSDYIKNEGKRFEVVVVSGGDGTVNEAFNGLMTIEANYRPALGYIPMGTTNDFASSSTIPTDPFQAAKSIAEGYDMRIDAGKFNDRYFSYIAAFGAFTRVSYDTPQQIKNIFGHAAYVVEGIRSLSEIKSARLKLQTAEGTIEDEFIFGMVANSKSVGGFKIKSMDIDLSDGLFEVILIKKVEKATDINTIVSDLMNKKTVSDYYYVFKTDKIRITSDESIAWTLDGEFGGKISEAVIENIPEAIRIRNIG